MAPRTLTEVELEAAHWIAVLDSPATSSVEIARFHSWLAASEDHKRAYEALAVTSDKIDAFLSAEAPARNPQSPARMSRRFLVGGAIAASATGAVLLARPLLERSKRETFAAPMRQPRVLALSDGSSVELGPGALMYATINDELRRIRFEQGVALFNVAHDARPFVVSTRYGSIRALGTEFVVRLREDRAIATVLTGRVEARKPSLWLDQDTPPDAVCGANSEIVLEKDSVSVSPLQQDGVERRLIWRDRMVALDDQSLRDAATEIERFTGVRFVFSDAATAEVRLSGYVEGDDVDGFIALLALNVGVEAEHRADGAIVLSQRRSPYE